ncbi:MAG TPA: rhomboid family intramembrane serine protease [Pyrinomonadaceae bacterium]|nr:rhomboid family intramembrane serine protease [Pyrinomonadaceae bacterium]
MPAKFSIMDYGYIGNKGPIGCTARELLEVVVQRQKEISFVWTPGTPEPVRPEQVPFLIGALRDTKTTEARNWIVFGFSAMTLGISSAYVFEDSMGLDRNVFLALGAFCLAMGNTMYWRSRSYTQENAVSDASTARFDTWVYRKSLSVYTIAILASCALATMVASWAADSTALAGLVKSAVWDGEVWRLFTAPLIHAEFRHFLISAAGLIHFTKITEQTIHRALVPLLFIVTAVMGSVCSLLFDPVISSMGGASGGLMGLVGFIAAAAFVDRTYYPDGYFKRMLVIMVTFFAVNIFGFEFFDPTAGFGGLVTGGILGWLSAKLALPPISGKLAKLIGAGGVLALVSTAVFAVTRLVS